MKINITGLFQNPQTNLIYLNPQLIVKSRVGYPEILIIDVEIISQNTPIGSMRYYPPQELDKNTENTNMSQFCEYVILEIKKNNHINSECTYTIEN